MLDEAHVFDALPAYALGSLEGAEAKAVGEHLAGCLLCRRELQAYEAVAGQLVLVAPLTAAPPSALKGRLMDRIGRLQPQPAPPPASPRQGWWLRLQPLWGVTAILIILSLALANILLWQRLNNQELLTSPQGMRAITLHSTDAAPQASGFVLIGSDGQNGALIVDAMPQLDPANEYQVWLIRDEEIVSGAIFSVDETGYRGVRLQAPEPLHLYSAVRVTIEPVEGSERPTGAAVMTGVLPRP